MKPTFRLNLCLLGISCYRLALSAVRFAIRNKDRADIFNREIDTAKRYAAHGRRWLAHWMVVCLNTNARRP